jgi:hypothetical protein
MPHNNNIQVLNRRRLTSNTDRFTDIKGSSTEDSSANSHFRWLLLLLLLKVRLRLWRPQSQSGKTCLPSGPIGTASSRTMAEVGTPAAP